MFYIELFLVKLSRIWLNLEWQVSNSILTALDDSTSINHIAFFQSAAHGGEPCSQFKAYALAHKGKAMADVAYNPEDPPSAYSNESIHSRL